MPRQTKAFRRAGCTFSLTECFGTDIVVPSRADPERKCATVQKKITYHQNKYFMSEEVFVLPQRMHQPIEEHCHDFLELVYMYRGKCVHTIDDGEYPVSHGDMLMINYNQRHAVKGDSSVEFINILIKPEFISSNLDRPDNAFSLLSLKEFEEFRRIVNEKNCVISFSGGERSNLEALILSLRKELSDRSPGWQLAVRSQLNLLLITVFRKMSLVREPVGQLSETLLAYIRQHCEEKLTLKELAIQNNYNPSYFSRLFRQYTHMCFTDYLRTVRLEEAKRLLQFSDTKINDIYPKVGYSDKTRFFKDFRRFVGMSPLEYRKSKK